MSHKGHRAKALASLIEAGPSTSAGKLLPPASLVVEKPHKAKKSSSSSSKAKKSVKDGLVGSSGNVSGSGLKDKSGGGKGKSKEVEEMERARKGLGEVGGDEDESMGMDVDQSLTADAEGAWITKPSRKSAKDQDDEDEDDDDDEMLIDVNPTTNSSNKDTETLTAYELNARRILESDTSKPTPMLPLRSSTTSTTPAPAPNPNDLNYVPIPLDPTASSSAFTPLSSATNNTTQTHLLLKPESRKIQIPPHRLTPLKREWVNLYGPLVEMMGLMVRMNVGRRMVELKVSLGLLISFDLIYSLYPGGAAERVRVFEKGRKSSGQRQ